MLKWKLEMRVNVTSFWIIHSVVWGFLSLFLQCQWTPGTCRLGLETEKFCCAAVFAEAITAEGMLILSLLTPVWNWLSYTVHSVTFGKDVWTWLFLCILGECGERNFPPAVSHIPVHIGGPVLEPPVKCLHLCVHIPQPVSLSAPAFNHRPPEAQKYHLLQFLLPGVSKRRWEFFHQLGSLQYFLAKVHFFKPFLLKKMEESFSAVAAEVFPQGKYHRKQALQERNAHVVLFHQLDLVLLLLQPWFLFLFMMLFVVNVGVDADRNACMVRNFTQTAWWTCSWLLSGAGHPAGHLRLNSPEAASQRKLGQGQGSALLFLLQNHETNGASRNWQSEVWAM